MIIKLADHYGLCFGVRDAIAEATRLAKQGPLTILGELVHNPVVRERLSSAGVREGSLDRPAETDQVMITAHGTSDAMRDAWKQSGRGVADGTCPLVRNAHEQLRTLVALGYLPVVIGKRGHVEVNGLVGDFPSTIVIQNEADVAALPRDQRLGIISQTTQPIERVLDLVAAIRSLQHEREVRFVDTVCQPTKNRQTALQKLISECDTIVVVGGRNSNNTLQLVHAAESSGVRVIHIERAEELQPENLRHSRVVGLTAGTSTLKETVADVHAELVRIADRVSRASGATAGDEIASPDQTAA